MKTRNIFKSMPWQRIAKLRSGAHFAGLLALGLSACSLDSLVKTDGELGRISPDGMQTEEAALALFNGAVMPFRLVFAGQYTTDGGIVRMTSIFTDEMMSGVTSSVSTFPSAESNVILQFHTRRIPEDNTYRRTMQESQFRNLNLTRNQASDGINALTKYALNQPKDLTGHLHSIKGWSLLWLAEIYCSGIPLSEYLGGGGYTYTAGVSSDSVYKLALVQFDSAMPLLTDSLNYKYLAQVGKARVLLNMGEFDKAAQAVQGVPTSFKFTNPYSASGVAPSLVATVWSNQNTNPENNIGTVGDREGINGLPFASSRDPRIPLVRHPTQHNTYPTVYKIPAWLFPTGTPWFGTSSRPHIAQELTVTTGVAARLTEAEASINAGTNAWLGILNTLRTTGTFTGTREDTVVNGTDTTIYLDTLWGAGTGGVAGLGPLTDPGNKAARVKMLYDERAYWLYFTANRQGDLRRLVRVYGLPQNQVYPTGPVAVEPFRSFGEDVNIPVPHTEEALNPNYKGCFNRDA